jgi:hypothetical protein
MLRIAAITTVYDEREFMPIWHGHYARLIGAENLFIIDDGSTDGSTDGLEPSHVIKRPKAPIDQIVRAAMIGYMTEALLAYYDVVIYVDVDELLVVDPLIRLPFADYLAKIPGKHFNAVGFNILHRAEHEPDYEPSVPVLEVRQWLEFEFGYCKQLVHKAPAKYGAGFHRTNKPLNFAPGLYLLHLRAFDTRVALRRIEHRRRLAWSDRSLRLGHGSQNRQTPEQYMAEVNPYRPEDYEAAPRMALFNDFVVAKLKALEGLEKYQDFEQAGLTRGLVERPDRFRGVIHPVLERVAATNATGRIVGRDQAEDMFNVALAAAHELALEVDLE